MGKTMSIRFSTPPGDREPTPPAGLKHADWLESELPLVRDLLGIAPSASGERLLQFLPFVPGDATAGAEDEWQAVVAGNRDAVDFPQVIAASNYYRNLARRAAAGDTSHRLIDELTDFLDHNPDGIWENSWVRLPMDRLSPFARQVWDRDLLADKRHPDGPRRSDTDRFHLERPDGTWLRIPISYLLKLSLADVLDSKPDTPPVTRRVGMRLLNHFLNDNSSPETFSFAPVDLNRRAGMGRVLARESLTRFLLAQMLTLYANRRFGLLESGQRAMVYCAPTTHLRQKRFSELVSDAWYREMFMSPCLAGWDRGEDKHRYMNLCHQVLSRSQLNTLARLREAGIITRNLVVLPSPSNLSLGNNGTHVSLGSTKLTRLLGETGSGFTAGHEKYMGDLVIKIVEHFLPLFVGAFSAAPHRLDFQDFHPEKALGFLPHELDFTHLRMLWRRWRKKAKLKILGQPLTPFGPRMLDRWLARGFGLRGDLVPDFRLIDYFIAVPGTLENPSLNGSPGNDRRLKRDLADFGIFDPAMPMYLPYRLRERAIMGFSGFEGRHYSQFPDLTLDMGDAVSLQTLVTALAFHWVLSGAVTHDQIPAHPFVESERRQIFFGAAIGLPTFFIQREGGNHLLRKILSHCERLRFSRRYPGYLRIYHLEYRRALVRLLRKEGAGLIEMMGLSDMMERLVERVERPNEAGAAGRLTRGIMEHLGERAGKREERRAGRDPLSVPAEEFNHAAEAYYRTTLRRQRMEAGLDLLDRDFRNLDAQAVLRREPHADALWRIMSGTAGERGAAGAWEFLDAVRPTLLAETISDDNLIRLIHLTLLSLYHPVADGKHP